MKLFSTILLFLLLGQLIAQAQKTDTLFIRPTDVRPSVLNPGIHRWLVYFRMGKDSSRSRFSTWTRQIDLISYQGKEAISVTQEWEASDTVVHKVYSVCDRKTFAPLLHEVWNKGNTSSRWDFLKQTALIDGKTVNSRNTDSNQVKRYTAFEQSFGQYVLNWHLDLETFPILPYRPNTTFAINFYDPGFSAPKIVYYTVTGSAMLTGFDGQQIDCWTLEHEDNDRVKNREVFYISKKTKEVLKLEQQFGTRYRYKIKLGFSI